MTIEQRLERLERRANCYRNALVLLVMSVCAVGLIGATIAACVPLHLLRKHAGLLGLLVAGLLVLLLLPGVPESLVRPRNGARRWISLVVFDLQPSELARVAWCLLMARLLYAGDAHRRLSGLLRPVALTAIAGGLPTSASLSSATSCNSLTAMPSKVISKACTTVFLTF